VKRLTTAKRRDWQATVEQRGLVWHTVNGEPYWNEGTYYSFTAAEIEEIETATVELYDLFLEAGQAVIDDPAGMDVFGIPQWCRGPIREAWNGEPPALNFGRFDLGYDGKGPPKLFEFNCDTPTSLLEAAVIQWDWKEQVFPRLDQFNSLHDKLVGKWADIRSLLPGQRLYFTHIADQAGEDSVTAAYLRDTATAAGLQTATILIDDLGWHRERRRFVDLDGNSIAAIHHLYPWEWLVNETFGRCLIESLPSTIWIEPIWKMIWSNKAILPVLSAMFPDHPNLLYSTYHQGDPAEHGFGAGNYVVKPKLAREGANIVIIRDGHMIVDTGGEYGGDGYITQDLFELPEMAVDTFPVLGSWIVDGEAAGMGIREDGLVTSNTARFVPHVIEG
jgi:glutathionylspermidine synthase